MVDAIMLMARRDGLSTGSSQQSLLLLPSEHRTSGQLHIDSSTSHNSYHHIDSFHIDMRGINFSQIYTGYSIQNAEYTSTDSWRNFGPLDFVLRTLRTLRPCDPRVSD